VDVDREKRIYQMSLEMWGDAIGRMGNKTLFTGKWDNKAGRVIGGAGADSISMTYNTSVKTGEFCSIYIWAGNSEDPMCNPDISMDTSSLEISQVVIRLCSMQV
jgi:hypothetical protein